MQILQSGPHKGNVFSFLRFFEEDLEMSLGNSLPKNTKEKKMTVVRLNIKLRWARANSYKSAYLLRRKH